MSQTNEGVNFSLPPGYVAQISPEDYWNGTTFASTCVANAPQLDLITVTFDGTPHEISVVINNPAAPPVPTCSSGPATQLAFIAEPGNGTVVSSLSPAPVVEVECANGLVDTSDLSQVNLAITAGTGTSGATLSSNCSENDVFGVVTFSNCSITTVGNGYTLTATDGSLPPITTSPFNLAVGPPIQLAFIAVPSGSPQASGTASIGAYQVQEQDQFGNPAPATSAVTVNLSTSSAGTPGYTPFFSLFQGGASGTAVTSVTIADGSSTTAAFYYSDTSAGVPTLSASSSGLYSATATTTISPAAASKLVYTTSPPTPVEVGTKFSVVVAEEDVYGNTETSDSSTALSLSISGGFSCSSTPSHVTTGVATYAGCSYTTADGSTYTLTASSPGLTSATASIMVFGTPSKLVYTTSPPVSTTAGTTFSVVVAEEDAFSNTETIDSTTALRLTASNGSGNGGFACATTPTNVTNGIATYTGCSYSVASGTAYTLTASSSGLTSATATTTVLPASASKLVFTTSPPASTTAFSTFSVVVAEEDALGNTETSDSTTALSVAASSGSGSGGFSCTIFPTIVTYGIATYTGCSYTVPSNTAYTLTASSSGLTSATATTLVSQATQMISFTSTAPSGKIYSGSNSQTYTVTATGGASGNPVTFTIDSLSTSGCTILGSTVSYGAGVGTCIIDANQAGNTDYAAATQVQQTFSVGQATQTISFTSTAPSGKIYSGSNS
ncbi:MAG: beta strand repeat-containing protein, partial [Acidimicrobiales bacterium]